MAFSAAPDLGRRCLGVARGIGERLASPDEVRRYHDVVSAQLPYYRTRPFDPACLFLGTSGTAMLHIALYEATGEAVWAERAREHIAAAARSLGGRAVAAGVHGGYGGLLAAASYAGRSRGLFTPIRQHVTAALVNQSRGIAERAMRLGRASMSTYDLFDGLAGICIALAMEDVPAAADVIGEFAQWLAADPDRWLIEKPGEKDVMVHDLGLTHGIGGVFAALGACPPTTAGANATAALVALLQGWFRDVDGPLWPHDDVRGAQPLPGRVAWCYGSLGLASAIWWAAARYDLADARAWALGTLESLAALEVAQWRTSDAALCHGTAGVALIAGAMAAAAGSDALAEMSRGALELTLFAYDDGAELGYRSDDPSGLRSDSATVGEGAAGIALALLTCARLADPSWTVYFGIPAPGREGAAGAL